MKEKKAKFEYGTVIVTPMVRDKMKTDQAFQSFVTTCLGRYIKGDWGASSPDDKSDNNDAVREGEGRIFAAYKRYDADGEEFIWIETESDRETTIIMFPEEN